MKDTDTYEFYPQYCFSASPTYDRWCPLRATDIYALRSHPGFEGQSIYFHLNHPIKWVRIVGVVVAIDEYYGRRIYTVDDSTGQCIECSWTLALPQEKRDPEASKKGSDAPAARVDEAAKPAPELDVGMVVDVKGTIRIFREQKQINMVRFQHIRSTNREVQLWNKMREFRATVLGKPWALRPKEVRRCRRDDQSRFQEETSKDRRERLKTMRIPHRHRSGKPERPSNDGVGDAERKTRDRASRSRRQPAAAHVGGQYDALGL